LDQFDANLVEDRVRLHLSYLSRVSR